MDEVLSCAECGARVRRKAGGGAGAGSRWSCPKCRAVNGLARLEKAVGSALQPARGGSISRSRTGSVSDSPADLLRSLFAGFNGSVPRRGPGPGYRLALVVTAVGILLLMVTFLATIVAGGFGLYWYATTIVPTAFQLRGRAATLLLAVHATVLLAWGGLLVSTLLPVFHRRGQGVPGQLVPPSEATVLYSFVARIAEALGAPAPREIRFTLDANASASYLGGLRGLRRGDLVLTLGAPLLAGLDITQLAGVIAHELGHFSQRGGTLVRYFVAGFTEWCRDVVDVQTAFGEMTGEFEPDDNGLVILIRGVFGLVQKLGTLVVWCFAMSGLLLTTFVMRQQEYDADRYQAELAGSDMVRDTLRRLIELNLGQERILKRGLSNLVAVLESEEGVGHFAAEVVAAADLAREKSVKQIERALVTRTGWFDTHPGNLVRLAAVEKQPKPGIFHLRMPAYVLYRAFDPNPATG